MRTYVIYFRYTKPGEKKPGNITHYKILARDLEQAGEIAGTYANYPGIDVLEIREA